MRRIYIYGDTTDANALKMLVEDGFNQLVLILSFDKFGVNK